MAFVAAFTAEQPSRSLHRVRPEFDRDRSDLALAKDLEFDGVVVHAEPEFDSLATAAAALGRPEYEIAQRASAALASARLLPGERLPAGLAEGR